MDLFGVKIVTFKRSMENGLLTLRLGWLRDLPALYSLLTSETFPNSKVSKGKLYSLFSFYRWMKRTFEVIYLIEIEENGGRRIVGLVGLYDMDLGRRVSLSLAVFNPEDRRRGYGEKALTLLLNLIERNGAAKVVDAEILKDNTPSVRLCIKAGFRLKGVYQDRFLLEKNEETRFEEGRR